MSKIIGLIVKTNEKPVDTKQADKGKKSSDNKKSE